MSHLAYSFKILLLAFPLAFVSMAFGQIALYIKKQTWTEHYKSSSRFIITNRFRMIDFLMDLIVGIFMYSEIFLRIHYEKSFVRNTLFMSLLIVFIIEKLFRIHLCGKIF